MKNISVSYTNLMSLVSTKNLELQFVEHAESYDLFAAEGLILWETNILKSSDDCTNFEATYKSTSNKPGKGLVKIDTSYHGGKPTVRSESRPDGTVHYFTSRGDGSSIGDGTVWLWDFSNSDNNISAPEGFTRKRIDVTFSDPIYPKEGTLYFHSAPKGCYVDFFIICPNGGYYLHHDGTIKQASGEVTVEHYVNYHHIQGSAPMGDELNTESASVNAVPAGYIFRLEVTTPDSDTTSNGTVELELFRTRTSLHPGESV